MIVVKLINFIFQYFVRFLSVFYVPVPYTTFQTSILDMCYQCNRKNSMKFARIAPAKLMPMFEFIVKLSD